MFEIQLASCSSFYVTFLGPFNDQVMEDFWLMIWQQHPSAIIMVTNTIAGRKVGEYHLITCNCLFQISALGILPNQLSPSEQLFC